MKRFISFSGGVESTTMCILYGKGATAIWCDTGWEHKEMYKRIDECEKRIKDIHGGDFTLLRIKPDCYVKGRRVKKYMPSKMARYCTRMFKIEPIDQFLTDQGECELMIGFNADEEPGADRTGNLMKCKNVTYSYPLHAAGIDREGCEDILTAHGLHPQFPIYMKRGGCEGCIFKELAEWKALYFFDRKTFKRNQRLEEGIQDRRKKFFTLSMTMKSLAQIASECENEIALWGIDRVKEMYKNTKPSQSCGAFCHR